VALPDDNDRKPVSITRILVWVGVAGIGAYMVISGIVGHH
jgi:hypothetical protein